MGRPPKEEGERVRDIAPTGVRIDRALREALARAATINGRSLNQEILTRLRDSLAGDRRAAAGAPRIMEPQAPAPGLTDAQRMLLQRYDQLTPDKQLALLQLLAR